MRLIGFILVACIALAAFKAMLAVLLSVWLIVLIWAVATRPKEMLGFLVLMFAAYMLDKHTGATLGTVAAVVITCAIAKRS